MNRLAFLLALGTVACAADPGFPPGWRIDGLRILGIRAEPPELAPGEETTLDALVVDPAPQATVSLAWVVCDPVVDGAASPCSAEQNASEIGKLLAAPPKGMTVVPFADTLRYRAPEHALDAWAPGSNERVRGVVALVLLVAFEGTDPQAIRDGGAYALALKRLRIAEERARNHNPEVATVDADGRELSAGPAPIGRKIELSAHASPGSAESYTRVLADGTSSESREEVVFSWYTTAGTFDSSSNDGAHTLDGGVLGLSLAAAADVYVVARDGRGGIGWTTRRLDIPRD